jgi:alginate O-acetyltransferase complex protein AlgI
MVYISMFPQLVAGPIVSFGTVRDEIHKREVTLGKFALGFKFFVIGLAQKVLIADTLAVPVDAIHKLPAEALTASMAWLSAIAYACKSISTLPATPTWPSGSA